MSAPQSYYVPVDAGEAEFTEKRSRFLGHVRRVETEAEARAFLDEMRKKYYDARHNCWCYVLHEGGVVRYGDDGEPQGTAGIPVLDVLEKSQTVDVCVVVTRYFGGILLGGGGLVRAYSHGAKIALDAGEIITMSLCSEMKAECDYTLYGKITPIITANGGKITDTQFTDKVEVCYTIVGENEKKLSSAIFEATNGKVMPQRLGEKFSAV